MTLAKLIDELNPQQKRAATATAQNCLVLAGAGCGKTKTIVARAAYLIDQGLPAQQVQILTFTRRAASEIVTRVEQHMGAQAKGLRASTFHTFCMYLLRRNPKAFGLTQFSIIDRDDQLLMFRLLRGKDKGNVLPKAAELCDLYSYARNTQTKLSDALVEQLPQAIEYKTQIAELMKAYEQRKQERNFLDYDDILAIVAVHLQNSPELVNWVTGFCSALLVDEMQDTNPLQWALLQPLIGKVKLFCVGDDAQSIYGFRGADFENIHHFKERVPDAEVLTLEVNYRSTQGILDLSNWLLGQSPIEYGKHLQAYRGQGLKPQLHILSNEFEEANWIVQDLNQRHLQGATWAEQKVCYVPHVSPTQYPHARAQGDFDDVEEERRVLYVALTRAENELILTKQNLNLWSHDQYDELGRKIESYFLNDLPQDLVDVQIHRQIPQSFGQSQTRYRVANNLGFGIDFD